MPIKDIAKRRQKNREWNARNPEAIKMPCMEQCEDCYNYDYKETEKMVISEQQQKEFEEVTRPVIKWLNENCHPHVSVVINPTSAELLEGICAYPTNDYIRD